MSEESTTTKTKRPKYSKERQRQIKEKETKVKKVTRQSAATAHEQEFAETIMAPKFWAILQEHNFDLTYTTLTTCYNTVHGTRLSASSIKKYTDLLGWKYERKPTWTGLEQYMQSISPQYGAPDQVDTAGILHGDDDAVVIPETSVGVGMMDALPGQGPLSPTEQALLG